MKRYKVTVVEVAVAENQQEGRWSHARDLLSIDVPPAIVGSLCNLILKELSIAGVQP